MAIPTGIIAAGFNQLINKEQRSEGEAAPKDNLSLDDMDEDDLISLQAEVSERLKEFGHSTTITIKGKK